MHNNQISKKNLPSFRKISATHSYTTRNAVSDKVCIPKTLHVKTDQSIRVTGPKIWNALPRIVMEKSSNVPLFKILIKSHFLFEQNYSWSYVRWVLISLLCICKGYHILYGALYTIVLHWSFPSLLLRFLLISPLSFVIFSFFSVCIGLKKFFIHDDQIYVEKKVYSKWQTSRCRLGNFPVLNRTHGLSCLLRWLMLLHKVIYFCGKLCVLCCASFIVSMNYSLSLIRPSTILKAISVLAFYLSNDYD